MVYFKKGFKFQPNACSGCHDLLVMSMNLPDIAVLGIKGADYCSIISAKSEAISVTL